MKKRIALTTISVLVVYLIVGLLYVTFSQRNKIESYSYNEDEEEIVIDESTNAKGVFNLNVTEDDKTETTESKNELELFTNCYNNRLSDAEYNSAIKDDLEKLTELMQSSSERVAFAYYDLSTGFKIGYNEDEIFFGASANKAPYSIYLMEEASKGNINLDETITYTEKYYHDGSGIIKNSSFDVPYSISKLIENMIIYSDNIGYGMLYSRFGRTNAKEFWDSIGATNYLTGNYKWGNLTANDGIIYLKEFYKFTENDKKYGSLLKGFWLNSVSSYILPNETIRNIAHKSGYAKGFANDLGIVYDKHPYAIALMSKKGYKDHHEFYTKLTELVDDIHTNYWNIKINKCNKLLTGNK